MIGILGGMGTQAGLDFCNKLAVLNRGKIDQEYPLFILYNKSNIPGRPESIGVQTGDISNSKTLKKNKKKYQAVLNSLLKGCKLLQKNNCKFIFTHLKKLLNRIQIDKIQLLYIAFWNVSHYFSISVGQQTYI